MYGLLLAIMVLDAIFLAIVILLQSGKGGGLAAVGGGAAGTEMLLGGRQAATILTRATWVAGGVFMFLAVVLSIMSSRAQVPQSILQDLLQQQAAPEPQPLLPFLGDSAAGTEGAAPAPAQGTPQPQTPPPPSGP